MTMRTIREATRGDLTLRLVEMKDGSLSGVVLRAAGGRQAMIMGTDREDVWRRLAEEAARGHHSYTGFDGARARFLRFFPQGFTDPRYLEMERDYKLRAKRRLDAAAPVEAAATGSGFAEAALTAFGDTNLLSPFEKTRVRDVLRGPSADAFVRAAARFALGGGAPALLDMERALRPHDSAKWTVATYLPFLWRPEAHMFLKPQATQDFAARVGHPFAQAYGAGLDMAVYESLLGLARQTQAELGALGPRDRIDVQSFIWVVGAYGEEELPPPA